MVDKPLTDPLIVCASEGKVLVEGPGVATTLGIECAANLSDDLLAASSHARLQQHAAIDQALNSGPSSSGQGDSQRVRLDGVAPNGRAA